MNKEPLLRFIQTNMPTANEQAAVDIAAHFEECVLLKNEYLLRAGRVSNEYLFLIEGFMRAFTFDTDNNEVTTNFFGKDRVVLEVSSFFTRTPATESIQALTDCRGYMITFETVNKLFHAVPAFREFGRTMLVREYAAFKQRTLALINTTAEERYDALFRANTALFQHAQLKQIASYLGITDTSLSRIRREYARRG
ncbi:Crp/Fnr family transcriptional regulator [Fibrella aquatilis]|uniref:Crp/Fnr family transcriptional regulator n=1 Tax=Fibrella aquatilis TaxID=2817059 RepID=A0A939G2F8_9BACT|nr:Crp/Fnr family transcriptional regulator [Fibrella aquatilis]MBO0929938.1 Crp/Fnr family transcriptional regulator [Fibrella aquatilis]